MNVIPLFEQLHASFLMDSVTDEARRLCLFLNVKIEFFDGFNIFSTRYMKPPQLRINNKFKDYLIITDLHQVRIMNYPQLYQELWESQFRSIGQFLHH